MCSPSKKHCLIICNSSSFFFFFRVIVRDFFIILSWYIIFRTDKLPSFVYSETVKESTYKIIMLQNVPNTQERAGAKTHRTTAQVSGWRERSGSWCGRVKLVVHQQTRAVPLNMGRVGNAAWCWLCCAIKDVVQSLNSISLRQTWTYEYITPLVSLLSCPSLPSALFPPFILLSFLLYLPYS